MRLQGRPATPDELIVNEKIFGECNHRDWSEFLDRFEDRVLVCTQCGGEFSYARGGAYPDTPSLSQSDFLLTAVRKYSEEEVLANLILRHVEAAGWRPLIKHEGETYACSFTRGTLSFSSELHGNRPAAVCEAAARLGASGKFISQARA